jgi:hypothetical protein
MKLLFNDCVRVSGTAIPRGGAVSHTRCMVFDLISTVMVQLQARVHSVQMVWKHQYAQFSALAWRPTNKQGLSIALQGDVSGLGRNESTPLAHARVCLVCVPKSMQWNLELGTLESKHAVQNFRTCNLELGNSPSISKHNFKVCDQHHDRRCSVLGVVSVTTRRSSEE